MKTINLAPGVTLPAEDFIESATGVLAKRGKGKSGGVKVIEEELLRHKLPFIVFDPVGIHWGLKSSFRGDKPSGYEVLVIGGRHGDLPLVRKAGREVAQSIADSDANLVIDLKGSPHAAYREFVTDFCDELLDINQRPRLQIFEEAHRLLPQKVRPDQTACLDAVQRTIAEGRNSALGSLIVSQRPATVSKDALTQVDNLILMGMTSPQDRKAVREWVEQNADAEDLDTFLKGLAGLQTREGWLWIPDKDLLEKFRFKDFETFHPDRTHLRKLGLLTVKPAQTDVDGLVERLGARMKTVAEEAKANDPRTLHAEIKRLRAELAKAPTTERIVEKRIPVVPVGFQRSLEGVAKQVADLAAVLPPSGEWGLHEVADPRAPARPRDPRLGGAAKDGSITPAKPAAVREVADEELAKHLPHTGGDGDAERKVQGGARRMLTVMCQYPAFPFDRETLGILSDMTGGSGGFNTALSVLHTEGLVRKDGNFVTASPKGRQFIGQVPPPKTDADIREIWRSKFTGLARRMFEAMEKSYPTRMSRDELGRVAGGSAGSGGFNTALSSLRVKHLLDEDRSGVRLNPTLFLEGIG